ncbi:MAG: hypothetical protein WBV10_02360 [Exiguobacterium marinum]|uniref:Uncharacterized protein n=1 Tax=Exiguobacterium marinum TaxID=273528 RepID=A0ABY7WYW1_9BACL|nr:MULTISPECIES: hypothetical protein [Exiguobacterium]WDH76062.1 hypothetical protein PTI97_00575 [Exiguobacterium marinum]
MNTKKMESEQLIERWVVRRIVSGESTASLANTAFVYGNDLMRLVLDRTDGSLQIMKESIDEVVVFRKPEDPDEENVCRCCGMEHSSFKAALECCAYLD